MRAWDSALFGAEGSVDVDVADDEDGLSADSPVRTIDSLTADETLIDDRSGGDADAPRIADAILYWLPSSNIESMAALTFRPQPQEVSRAILVRVDAR